jgi:glycosyltransferase involved in cell wall biosynthesis
MNVNFQTNPAINPHVSIIIPCYNASRWIEETLNSAIAQNYRPLEIIIIDDGSTDGSLQIIQYYAAQYHDLIRYEAAPHQGGCVARNRGFALSSGKYVMFLDADDFIKPETIAGQVETLDGRTDVIAACPWWNIEWTGNNWKIILPRAKQADDPIIDELRYGNFLPGPSLLWSRNILENLGGWDETLWANQDGDLRLRARLAGYQIIPSHRSGFAYRRYSRTTVSSTPSDSGLESRIRVLEKVESILENTGRLQKYALDLACAYHRLASGIMVYNEQLADRALSHAIRLGGIRSIQGTLKHRLLCYTIGLKRKERLARWIATSRLSWLLGRTRIPSPIVEYSPIPHE